MLNTDDLMEMRKMMAASQLVLEGQFKEQIEKLEKLQAEQNKRHGALIALEAAEKAKSLAEGVLVAAQARAKESDEKIAAKQKELAAQQAKLADALATAERERQVAVVMQRTLHNAMTDQAQANEKKMAELALREAALAKREVEQAQQKKDLTSRLARLRQIAA